MNPSPPLLPGPQRTATRLASAPSSASAAAATAAPAFSMSTMPGVPPAMVCRSAAAISAVVRSSRAPLIDLSWRAAGVEARRGRGFRGRRHAGPGHQSSSWKLIHLTSVIPQSWLSGRLLVELIDRLATERDAGSLDQIVGEIGTSLAIAR